MTRILLVHGWAFDATVWSEVIAQLPDFDCQTLDHGYFGAPRLEIPEGIRLVAGHSFGCLWAMQEPALAGVPLMAVNGFPRFSAAADYPHGTPPRVLERMLRRLREAPEEVLAAFRDRCGAPPPPPTFDVTCLERDLGRLLRDDARHLAGRQAARALAADDDPLLPVALSEQAFPGILTRLPRGGHLLPRTEPAAVARIIREVLP